MAEPRLKVTECFHSIQGESSYAGLPCAFIRLTGCPLRCTWCDTEYSFHGGQWMTHQEILDWVAGTGCDVVELTGGEPLAQKGSYALLASLCDAGYQVLLETAGSHDIAPVAPRVAKIIDVKCPGSGEEGRNRWENFEHLGPRDELKFVLADRTDYEYCRAVIRDRELEARPTRPLLSAVHGQLDAAELAAWILEDNLRVRMQVQMHKVIWGAETQGV